MGREIKFRAWHKKTEIMFDVMEINFVNKLVECYKDHGKAGCIHAGFKLNKIEVMQFTGLKDKKGVEIYEGDILKATSQNIDLAIVEIGEYLEDAEATYCGVFIKLKDGKEYGLSSQETEFAEVIGNIYENPELLNDLNQDKEVTE